MSPEQIEKLRYRRQYILTPEAINCPFQHKKTILSASLNLYTHPDLELTIRKEDTMILALLGDLVDAGSPEKSNREILDSISVSSFDQIVRDLSGYAGNFVLIFHRDGQTRLVHDATANKKVYFCRKAGSNWCASQPHLLARICGLSPSEDPSRKAYYSSEDFKALDHASIGYTTCYDEISQLLPNFYLNLETLEVTRYWPLEIRRPLTVDECAELSAYLIKGYMDGIISRNKVMLPVTAGKDSRTLLSATRDYSDRVYYYITRNASMGPDDPDIRVSGELMKELSLERHILEPVLPVDADFEKIYFENNPLAMPEILPNIYYYFVHFEDTVNLPGNVATGSSWKYPRLKKKYDTKLLTRLNHVSNYPHAAEAYSWWKTKSEDYARESGFSIFDLYYWEERMGNWGTQYQLDKDIAQSDFNVFNSRLLVETLLSVEPMYTLEFGSYILNRAIIRKLWPEALLMPINPSRKNNMVKLLERADLTGVLYWFWSNGLLKRF